MKKLNGVPNYVLIILVVAMTAGVFYQRIGVFKDKPSETASEKKEGEQALTLREENNNDRELTKDDFELSINNSGPFEDELGHKVYLNKNVVLKVRLRSSSIATKKIDVGSINVKLSGANSIDNILVKYEDGSLVGSYVPRKSGVDVMEVSLENGKIKTSAKILVLDNSFFNIPIDLDVNDVAFSVGENMGIEFSEVVPPYSNDSEPWWKMDLPGHLTYYFGSNEKAFNDAYLKVFPIANGAVEKYNSNDPFYDFGYLYNIKELKRALSEKTGISSDPGVADFPSEGAIRGPVYNIDFFNFKNGSGVRYLIGGYGLCKYPSYTYQGMTKDGKYLVLFRYEDLYSPALDEYLSQPRSYESGEDYTEYVNISCDVLENDRELSPSPEKLDKFVKSIEIKK